MGAVAHAVRIYDSVHHASGVGVVLKDVVPITTMVSCTYLIVGDEGLKPAASPKILVYIYVGVPGLSWTSIFASRSVHPFSCNAKSP
jgi:hypothetical protein